MTLKFEESNIDNLKKRVKVLESKIFNDSLHFNEGDQVLPALLSVGQNLGKALSTRDRMMRVMKRIDELETFLDPHFGDPSVLSEDIQIGTNYTNMEELQAQNAMLAKMQSLKKNLDSQALAGTIGKLNGSLIDCWQKYEQTSTLVNNQNEEIKKLLESYSSIIKSLNENYTIMNEAVTKAEEAVCK